MPSPDKPERISVVRIIFLTSVVVLPVIAVMAMMIRPRHGHDHRRVGTMNDVAMLKSALRTVAVELYPAFSKLPTNIVVSTSADVIARLPPGELLAGQLDYFIRSGLFSTNRGIIDRYGNYFNCIINREAPLESTGVTLRVSIWSNGPNGKNENGKGDDITAAFTFTVDPANVPSE